LQLNLIVLPKASSKEHLQSNLDFDFVISDEDMSILKSLMFDDYGEFSNFPVFSEK
ncbi:aldo/keto reductase, partial [Streptococcus agalactiae]|nr:aldo/keto reductase [Streptococcus agalactiae]MCK6369552.1 aldo/keto reductase [Streptococcus agalactiae]